MKKIYGWLLALSMICVAHGALAEVVLGAGDLIKITVFGNEDLTLETKVSDKGSITYPLIGEVEVGGITSADAEKKIATLLDKGGYIRNPQVNIVVTQLQSQQVSVLGQVNRPGRYPLDSTKNIVDVLALAGGITVDGGDIVTLIRNHGGKVSRETIDLNTIMQSNEGTGFAPLESGDVIYVDRAPKFYIYGEVQRPGVYRLERNMTIIQALSAGGGLTMRGTERGIEIKRRDKAGNLQVLSVKKDELLQTDDVVYVKESLF
jgi:polysaccharide export outer membrane protein